jgi:nicotinate-nucleotide adenylyltransferase
VTTFESSLGTRYTIDALRFLARRHPRVRFVWVMGADGLAELHRWRRWKDLARLAPLAVVDRPGYRLAAVSSPAARWMAGRRLPAADAARLPTAKPPAWTLLATRLSPLSSTQLRARMVKNRTTI